MRHLWQFGQQLLPNSPVIAADLSFRQVLIEYDGPKLAILERQGADFLSLVIDEDESATRRLEAPLSKLEEDALKSGALAVRDVLLKPEIVLVETAHDGSVRAAWELDLQTIPESILPERDALLPEYIRASHQSDLKPDVPAEFHLTAKGAPSNRLSFARLSKATATLQVVWDSLAVSLGAPELTLNAVAFAQGSLKVQVEVDDHDLFARVAGLYRGMTRATYNENRIAETFSRLPRTVAENYQQYLSTLNVNKLEVFAEWREGKEERSAFVGYAGAQRTRKAFRTIIQTTGVQRWTDTLTGYFEGFGRKPRHFEFYDEKTGNRVSGSITKALRDTPIAGELYLGRRLKYRVEIEHVKSGDKTKSTLLNFARTDD